MIRNLKHGTKVRVMQNLVYAISSVLIQSRRRNPLLG
jgi:hypothetical protein